MFISEKFVIRNVKIANDIVTAMLPVKLAAAGNKPKTFPKNIKKKRLTYMANTFHNCDQYLV